MADVKPVIQPQAALELGVRDAIRHRLNYTAGTCERTLDGRPWPACGDLFVSIWSDNARENSQKLSLDERFGVNITMTLRLKRPLDRQVEDRDELERRMNAIRVLIALDRRDHSLIRAANTHAGLTHDSAVTTRHVGFCEALCFARLDPIQPVAGEWFGGRGQAHGLAQTLVCDRARWIQALSTAV